MIHGIPPLTPPPVMGASAPVTATPGNEVAPPGGSFKDFLVNSLKDVNSAQQQADHAVQSLLTGGDVTEAEVLTAVQKADLAFRTMLQIRNKLVEAYNRVENIRV